MILAPKNSLREFACLTTVILAPLRMDGGLHAGSATSLPVVPVVPLVPDSKGQIDGLVSLSRPKIVPKLFKIRD